VVVDLLEMVHPPEALQAAAEQRVLDLVLRRVEVRAEHQPEVQHRVAAVPQILARVPQRRQRHYRRAFMALVPRSKLM